MAGAKIPVLEVEDFSQKPSGRGLVFNDDATNVDVQTWTGTSGGSVLDKKYLPAASAQAWLRVTIGSTAYYSPLFSQYW